MMIFRRKYKRWTKVCEGGARPTPWADTHTRDITGISLIPRGSSGQEPEARMIVLTADEIAEAHALAVKCGLIPEISQ